MNQLISMKNKLYPIGFLMLTLLITTPARCFAQTNMVGSLGGEVVVSDYGTASYSIPIEVVPGTHGMQPNLAITYSSASGRGLMGMGWTLTGLSSINRTQRNSYFDGAVGSVNFNGNDRYVLDGSRLIKLSGGNYATTNAEYGTEIENFTRVKLKGTPNDTSQYFIATTDQGQIIEYGHSNGSKQILGGNVLCWWVNKVTDPDGNYMRFEYTGSKGEKVPSQIHYTGNDVASLGTYAKVVFQYVQDPYVSKSWVGGKSMTQSRLLSNIAVYYGNDMVRSYSFEYDDDRNNRLTAVVLKDSSGVELTRTTIVWGADFTNVSYQSIFSLGENSVLPGDFNGDNIQDLFLYNYDNNSGTTSWLVKIGDAEGNYTASSLAGTINGAVSSPSSERIFVIDIDGDGIDDIGYISRLLRSGNYSFRTIRFTGVGYIDTLLDDNDTPEFYVGDFTGAGGIQLMKTTTTNGNVKVLSLNGSTASIVVPANGRIAVTDHNGNGKSDVFVSASNRINVYEYDEATETFVKIVDSNWTSYTPTMDAFGDFNGDGYQDYVFAVGSSTYMKLSKGNDYTPEYNMTCFGNIPSQSLMLVCDINNEGKDDIIRPVFNYSTQKLTLNVFYSRSFSDTTIYCDNLQLQYDSIFNTFASMYHFSDLNGDGKRELLYTGSIYQNPVVVNFPERREHDFVVSVTNGLGKTTSLEYQYYNSPMLGNLGTDGKRIHYPLVSRLRLPDGIGGIDTTTFTYGNAVFDYARQQMLGFEYHKSYRNGTFTLSTYKYNDTIHYLMPEQTLTYDLSGNNSVSGGYITDPAYWDPISNRFYYYETLNAVDYLELDHGRFLPYNKASSTHNRLEGNMVTMNYWLNSEGRIVQTSTIHQNAKTLNGAYPWISRDSTAYTYTIVSLPNGKTAVKPSSVRTWNRRKGFSQTPFRHTDYTYSSGRILKDSIYDSEGAVGVTSFTYNAYGLPITETNTPNGMTAATRKFTYDNKGRFVTQETNALLQTHTMAYNGPTGLLSQETDANSLTTQYQYDALGRPTRITQPDHTIHNISYHWNNISEFPNAVYYTMETEAGTPVAKTFYDILGRAIHTYLEGQGYHDMVYDHRGRLVRQTFIPYDNPTTAASSKTWHTLDYDNYDRVVEETAPYTDLAYSYYNYNEVSNRQYFVTVLDKIRNTRQTKTYDELGRLVSAEDDGGAINYSYAYETVAGKTRDSLTVSVGNAVTTIVSDIRGNRLSIHDPDAGTVTNTYNALNQLVSRTDANNNQTTFAYDIVGRRVRTVYEKGNQSDYVIYFYDNAPGKGIGKLASVSHNGNIDCRYVYDTLGRLYNYQVQDGNTQYDHLYQYDTLGRLEYLTYPDGFQIRHSYNSYGELSAIRDANDNSLIYSIETRNAFRQPLICRFGNEMGTQYTYNTYGMLTGIKNGNTVEQEIIVNGGVTGDPPIIQYFIGSQYRNLTYTYNSRGFIATKSDANVSQTETYYYDELDRLTSYDLNGLTEATFDYSGNGNITANSNVGDYSYDSNKPHAVTTIEGNSRCAIPPVQGSLTYNLRNLPETLSQSGYHIFLDYDASGMRRHTEIYNGHTLAKEKTRISSLYELDATPTSARRLDYIYAEGRIVAVHVDENSSRNLYYVLTDHLGSWEKVLDVNKTTVQQTHFDPWGNRMSYTSWNTPQTQTSFTFDRGFTGHEHYDCIRVINANARLYDPVIGRFFSPDPFVQAPDFTQSFNRYSYCLNNPVMYSDPTGEVFGIDDIIAAAALGAIFNAFTQIVAGNVNDVGDFFVAAGIGALSGAAGFAIGNGVNAAIAGGSFASGFVGSSTVSSTGFWAGAGTGAASGFASGFISGTGNSLLAGNNFRQSLQNGWKEGLMGLGSGAVIGGICGGIDAAINHREFFTGNAKQYDLFPANYASIDGGTEMFLNTDDYTVINNSDYVAYYKPEDGKYGVGEYKIDPHKGIKVNVDGLATCKYTDKVYKVPGKKIFHPQPIIANNGEVYFSKWNRIVLKPLSYTNYQFGWMTFDQLDSSWENLFRSALLIK